MDQLFELFLNMVRDNTNIKDYETQYVFATSILSIFLLKGNSIISKMPELLRSIDIYSDHRPVNEVLYDLGKTKDKSIGEGMLSCINREYFYHGDKLIENRQLIVPKKDGNETILHSIEKATHELIHLLRYGDIRRNESIIREQEGIRTRTKDLSNNHVTTIHSSLEEAIVQDNTLQALQYLKDYINDLSDNIFFFQIRKAKRTFESNIYKSHVILLKCFEEDPRFKKEVDLTFETKDPTSLSIYYNNMMDDGDAFMRLSRYYDQLNHFIDINDSPNAIKSVNDINNIIAKYRARQIQKIK